MPFIHILLQLCKEMDAEHMPPVLYTVVGWFSKGRSLARVCELGELLQRFLLEKQSVLAANFSNTKWVTKLAYLVCNIFNLLST